MDSLKAWAIGAEPQAEELQVLTHLELADSKRAAAFGVTPETVVGHIQERARLFCSVCQHKESLPQIPGWETLLWQLWLPLTLQLIAQHQSLGRPTVQGILGGQGTGKTTLGAALTQLLNLQGYRTLSLSLDDLYKSYADREQLRQVDPRLIWRGPPGTHDVKIGLQVLDQLRHPQPSQLISVPQFDKSLWQGMGDRIAPKSVTEVDIVLFEGWFVGCRPVNPVVFETAPEPIITTEDRQFAQDMNRKLQDYVPLWERLDRLMVLKPVDYKLSKQWRKQAEHNMIAQGKSGMSDAEVEQFVDYFWKALHPELLIKPLLQNPNLVDLVVEINADHSVGRIYQP
ncbi:MAG: glycerate kinase [Microcoleaceae cyanobacterium]